MALDHLEPRGVLYSMAARDPEVAHAVCDVADVYNVTLKGLSGTLHATIFPERGHVFRPDFFADLDDSDEGKLSITREPDAKDPTTFARRAQMETAGGKALEVKAETVCIHSDTPNAIAIAEALRNALRPARSSGNPPWTSRPARTREMRCPRATSSASSSR